MSEEKKEKMPDVITLKIGGREIPLMLSVFEALAIEEEIGCTIGEMRDRVFGIEHDMETDEWRFTVAKDKEKVRKLATLIRICGNAGLEEAGQAADLTDKWILRNMKVPMIVPYAVVMTAVVNEAMKMEAAEKKAEDGGPVDEVLAEENRKKEPGK